MVFAVDKRYYYKGLDEADIVGFEGDSLEEGIVLGGYILDYNIHHLDCTVDCIEYYIADLDTLALVLDIVVVVVVVVDVVVDVVVGVDID